MKNNSSLDWPSFSISSSGHCTIKREEEEDDISNSWSSLFDLDCCHWHLFDCLFFSLVRYYWDKWLLSIDLSSDTVCISSFTWPCFTRTTDHFFSLLLLSNRRIYLSFDFTAIENRMLTRCVVFTDGYPLCNERNRCVCVCVR